MSIRPLWLFPALVSLVFSATAQDQPTFRAGTRLVEVDVVVHNGKGPVDGLKKDDFTLLDQGKPRQIALFSITAGRSLINPAVPLPPGTVSNRFNSKGEAPATATILLIDRLNTPIASQVSANRKVLQFLKARRDRDRIGIYALGTSVRALQDLTDDQERLDRAVKRLHPQDARPLSPDVDVDSTGDAQTDEMIANALRELATFTVRSNVETTKQAMIAIARHLAHVPGRKNLIWISGSFPLLVINPHETIIFDKELDQASRALNDANVAVYPVDARGLIGTEMGSAEHGGVQNGRQGVISRPNPSGPVPGSDTMNTLASMTGGHAYYNTNGIEESIQKAIQDSELTYTLGFYPPEDSFDLKYHKLEVKVDRKGVDVRSRKGYFASLTEFGSGTTLSDLVQDSLNATAVGILVHSEPDAEQPGSYKVRATVDLRDIRLENQNGKWVGIVDVSLFVEGTKKIRTISRKIEIPDSQLASALEKGEVVENSIGADPRAELRVVAQDRTTGAAGSIRLRLGK
jgi:VWFA-related protein